MDQVMPGARKKESPTKAARGHPRTSLGDKQKRMDAEEEELQKFAEISLNGRQVRIPHKSGQE
jgi:hypothetical protein